MNETAIYLITGIIGLMFGGGISSVIYKNIIKRMRREKKKLDQYYNLLNQWLSKARDGEKCSKYFEHHKYKKIAIYGIKELGLQLLKELEKSDIEVAYIVDRDVSIVPKGLQSFLPDDELPDVDVIVVTASFYFFEIEEKIKKKLKCDIVPIDDVVCCSFEL